ncbi:MAG: addiction module protein [Kiritimatiellia bacterium]
MTTLEITQMTRAEKLQAMEAIWEDLSKSETDVESPSWHAKVLKETEERVTAGQERVVDWESAKQELRKRFE